MDIFSNGHKRENDHNKELHKSTTRKKLLNIY